MFIIQSLFSKSNVLGYTCTACFA
uniref:Uncharacterized protein n=1 Tax=Arundo donax TaxID=35708 RepID=A0A0A8YZT6_ARUDO